MYSESVSAILKRQQTSFQKTAQEGWSWEQDDVKKKRRLCAIQSAYLGKTTILLKCSQYCTQYIPYDA